MPNIKIGDIVKINKPDLFLRCGYPLSKQDVLKDLEQHRGRISDFVAEILGYNSEDGEKWCCSKFKVYPAFYDTEVKNSISIDKILNTIAYMKLKKENFGGSKRSIHNIFSPEYQDKIYIVAGKKRVVTGYYSAGWSSLDEGEPASLYNQKHHVILYLDKIIHESYYYPKNTHEEEFTYIHPYSGDRTIRIQKEFVEKIEDQNQKNEYDSFQFHTYRVDKVDLSKP